MSLVQAIITKNFILVCGEQKAIMTDGTIRNDYIKIQKLSDTVIIGMTGNIEDNRTLFSEYVNLHLKKFDDVQPSYQEVINKTTESFLYITNDADKCGIEFDVISIVCGWDGSQFTGKCFFHGGDQSKKGIFDIVPTEKEPYNFVTCGEDRHHDALIKYINMQSSHTILNFKNCFKDVLKEGIKFDETINDKYSFETIRKGDIK